MTAKSVLLVGDPPVTGEVAQSLSAAGVTVVEALPQAAPGVAREAGPAVACVGPFVDGTHVRYPAWFSSQLGAAAPPVLVVQRTPEAASRDQAVVSGALEVASLVDPVDLVTRLESLLEPFARGARPQPFAVTLKAQRGRQVVELPAVDIDLSGVGLASAADLPPNELVRFSIALSPGDSFTLWARLASSDTGPVARFVGLLAEERSRLGAALVARAKAGSVAASSQTLPPGAVNALASSPGLPRAPLGPPPGAAVNRTLSTPPVVRPPPMVKPPAMPAGATPVPATHAAAPAAVVTPAPQKAATAALVTPPPAPVAAAPAGPASAEPAPGAMAAIGDAIGELLGDAPAPAAAAAAAEADTLNAVLEAARPSWPASVPTVEASLESLSTAATMGLASDEAGAPPGHIVVEFAKRMSPIERRFFDEVPPTEIADPELLKRSLAVRLVAYSIQRDAEAVLAAATPVAVDDAQIAIVAGYVDAANAALQKVVDGFVLQAATEKIRDVNQFKVALTRSLTDLRAVVGRIKGEEHLQGGNAALLDVAERVPGQEQAVRLRGPPKEEKAPEKPVANQFTKPGELTLEQKSRRRAAWLSILPISLAIVGWLTAPPSAKPLELSDLGNPPGVTAALAGGDGKRVRFSVVPDFKLDPRQSAALGAKLDELGFPQATFLDPAGQLRAFKQGKDQPIRFMPQPKKK